MRYKILVSIFLATVVLCVLALTLSGCVPGSAFRPEPLTSPALTAEETAAVQAARIAHGALRETAGALDLAYQYMSRKAAPCKAVVSDKCLARKRRLEGLYASAKVKETELDQARQMVAIGNYAIGNATAVSIKEMLIRLQMEIDAVN
jgi:hypothetical protein